MLAGSGTLVRQWSGLSNVNGEVCPIAQLICIRGAEYRSRICLTDPGRKIRYYNSTSCGCRCLGIIGRPSWTAESRDPSLIVIDLRGLLDTLIITHASRQTSSSASGLHLRLQEVFPTIELCPILLVFILEFQTMDFAINSLRRRYGKSNTDKQHGD